MSSRPMVRIVTDNPQREIWRYLRLFTRESYIGDFVKDQKAKKQVISCLKQAEEIYSLSKSASILTKPILYYYGMQRLAKSLIFFKNPETDQKNLRHHGLVGAGVSSDIENFLDSKIQVTKIGIFREFSKLTTRNRILLSKTVYAKDDTHYDARWVKDSEITEFLKSSEFKVGDLFRQVPELLSLFDYLELKNDFLIPCHFSIREHPDGKLDQLIVVAKRLEPEKLKEKFPELKEYEVKRNSDNIMLTRESKDELVLPARMVQGESRELFLVNAPNDDTAITDLNLHFLLMFLLARARDGENIESS